MSAPTGEAPQLLSASQVAEIAVAVAEALRPALEAILSELRSGRRED